MHCLDAYRLKSIDPMPDDGIVVHRLESPFGFISPLITQLTGRPGIKSRATRDILDRPFDVVHFHNISLVGGPALITRSRSPVSLYTLHDHWLLCPTHVFWKNNSKPCDRPTCFSCSLASGIPPQLWRYTRLVERSMAQVDAMLAPSKYTARRHGDGGLQPPIHVLPSFSAIEQQFDYVPRHDRPRFLFVGRLTASKGIVQLLEEFAGLPAYDLHVVGDGDLRGKLEHRFACCSNIRFLGPKPQAELVPLYQNATALILPSLAPETFALSVIEAFACRTPAIVHEAGGAGEPIEATEGSFTERPMSFA
jgi:glycosyltransferase involved in cell wall biosynthesis